MERRSYERVGFLCRVALAVRPGAPPLEARSVDLSMGGAGIVTSAALQVGQTVGLTFFLKDARQQEVRDQVQGRVVNLKADLDCNRVGVEFLEPLHESKNPALVRKLLAL
jgi:c-di-GMP-binding flagellar brake protein YcgR